MNFGGGRTNNPNDALLHFKIKLTNNTLPFLIGKRIHINDIYQNIKDEYILKNGKDKYEQVKNYLQFYRM